MSQHTTNVLCPVCKKGDIVAEVDTDATVSMEEMPIGPGSASYFRTRVTSFHCNADACQVLFHHPPGIPNAASKILEQIRTAERQAEAEQVSAEAVLHIKELIESNPDLKEFFPEEKPHE